MHINATILRVLDITNLVIMCIFNSIIFYVKYRNDRPSEINCVILDIIVLTVFVSIYFLMAKDVLIMGSVYPDNTIINICELRHK